MQIAILGAGPIGLEAALYAAKLQLRAVVYEKGRIGEHLRQWGHLKLFTPFGMNTTTLGRSVSKGTLPRETELLTGRELVNVYLEPLANCDLLRERVRTGTTVVGIGHEERFSLLLRSEDGAERLEEADVILDCTGLYAMGRNLGPGGVPVPGELAASAHIARGLDDIRGEARKLYADKTTLVIGSGHSAATTVSLLASLAADHPLTWIVWLARRASGQPIRRIVHDPLRERDTIAARANQLATRGEGNLEFHQGARITAVEHVGDGFIVEAVIGTSHGRSAQSKTWEVDRLVANVGYRGERLFVEELSPGYHILGSKSQPDPTGFLLQMGFEQIRQVFAKLLKKPDLDLYSSSR